MYLAEERSKLLQVSSENSSDFEMLAKAELRKHHLQLDENSKRAWISKSLPKTDHEETERILDQLQIMREQDPLTVLHTDLGVEDNNEGQLSMFKLVPNFEMSVFIAKATGAAIVTDDHNRWKEILYAISNASILQTQNVQALSNAISATPFTLPADISDILELNLDSSCRVYPAVFRKTLKYLQSLHKQGAKPNAEAHLQSFFKRADQRFKKRIEKAAVPVTKIQVTSTFPRDGIYDSSVSRLLLMSSSEHHQKKIPLALFLRKLSG